MRRWLVLPAIAVLALAGCTSTVTLTTAPEGTSRACAAVAVRLPQTIADADRRTTDAQGTAAWGDDPAITLRCGVARTPASECGTVDGIDWTTENAQLGGRRTVVLTTFGRAPVIQVVKPAGGRAGTAAIAESDVLLAVSDAVHDGTRATGERCGSGGPISTPSSSPSPESTATHGPGPAA